MVLEACNSQPWKISRKSERDFSITEIEKALTFFNRAANGCFYLIDYKQVKFFFGKTSCPTLCGYSRDVVKKKNFLFYDNILSAEEQNWFEKMHKSAMGIFYQYDNLELRKNLELSFNLAATDIHGKEIIMHQKLIPCEFDENGNLWRALSFVWASPFSLIEHSAKIENYETGERFDYENGIFRSSKQKCLTQDEIAVLEYLAKGFESKEIYEQLAIGVNIFNELKRNIFLKLDVKNQTHAVCEAIKLGIIHL